ncbi:MAG: AHH domain-containing protein [Sphingomonadales bacterium]
MLLPANEDATLRTGMPLHRGPHHRYNGVVIARVGRIEASWSHARCHEPELALAEVLMRVHLL